MSIVTVIILPFISELPSFHL